MNRLGGRSLHSALYWLGVILAVSCGSIILVGHTTLLDHSSQEHGPLSWVLGGLAILSFAAYECFSPADAFYTETPVKRKAVNPGWLLRRSPVVLKNNANLLPQQDAALSQAMDLLDQAATCLTSGDRPTAMELIDQTRQRLEDVKRVSDEIVVGDAE